MDVSIIITIIFSIFFWFFLGYSSAEVLIGDITLYYPTSSWGPFNEYTLHPELINEKSYNPKKKNARKKFYLTLGGLLSFIFVLCYFIIKGVINIINHIKWMYSKE